MTSPASRQPSVEALLELIQRDVHGAGQVSGGVLGPRSDIKDDDLAGLGPGQQIGDVDLLQGSPGQAPRAARSCWSALPRGMP